MKMRKSYLEEIEASLEAFLPADPCAQHEVIDAMRYSLLGGGKRVRATLVLSFCEACGADYQLAMPAAAAIEMVHAYSLIHDDLPCMDDSALRRGKPSCHKQFGETTALLAGDGLLTLAFSVLPRGLLERGVPAQRVVEAVSALADAAGVYGMIGGQVLDLAAEEKTIEKEELYTLHALKTGALIRASVAMGCIIGGADDAQKAAADAYAKDIGLSFQVEDDILDVTSSPEVLGKPTGSDQVNEKNTFITLFGLERSRQMVEELTRSALCHLHAFGVEEGPLYQFTEELARRGY